MEKPLEKQMNDVYQVPGVTGIICVDSSGFCLGAKGNVPQQCTGSIRALAIQAARLSQNPSASSPVICLEADQGSVLIRKTDQVTTAIFKSS